MITGISIIICCYNSASRLEKTIKHIALQKEVDFTFEVVLVDNNSSDNTTEVAEQLFLKHKITNYNIVLESKPGLSFARKTGVRASEGEILVFCDDDNWLEANYLRNVMLGFEKYPAAGILGAWSIAAFEPEQIVPQWFGQIKGSMAVGGKPDFDCIVKEVWGAGMSIRTKVALEIFQTNNVLSDRKRNSLFSGGDTEICQKVRKLGYKIYKLTSLKYTHFITPERLTWDYLTRLNTGFGYSSMQLQYHKYHKSIYRLFFGYGFYTIKAIFKNPKGFIFYFFKISDKVSSINFYGIKGAWHFIYGKLQSN